MTRRVSAGSVAIAVMLGLGLSACGGGGAGSVASFCSEVKTDRSKLADATDSAAGLAALEKAESSAPSAIKSDMKTLVDFVQSVAAKQQPSASEVAKVTEAGQNITAYVKDKCNIDLNTNG